MSDQTQLVEILTEDQVLEAERIEAQGNETLVRIQALEITTADEMAEAVEAAQRIRGEIKKVNDWWEPLIRPQRQQLDVMYARRRSAVQPREDAVKLLTQKVGGYRQKIAAEARRREAEERRRLEAEAKAKREAAFDEAAAKGDDERAEAIAEHVSAPVATPPVAQEHVEREAPKLAGMAERKTWRARLAGGEGNETEALRELCGAIARGAASTKYVEANWKALNQLAEATAGEVAVPGVEFYEHVQTQIRRT